jgi:hypothetical protein
MNSLLNKTTDQANAPGHVVVSLITTESKILNRATDTSGADQLVLQDELRRRADAMTEVLQKIMDRPAAPRFWGLNE